MLITIKARLAELRKTNRDLIAELNARGVECSDASFSMALSGARTGPKAELIIKTAERILAEWEKGKK